MFGGQISKRASGEMWSGSCLLWGLFLVCVFLLATRLLQVFVGGQAVVGGGEGTETFARTSERVDVPQESLFLSGGGNLFNRFRGEGGCAVCCAGWVGEPVEKQLFYELCLL